MGPQDRGAEGVELPLRQRLRACCGSVRLLTSPAALPQPHAGPRSAVSGAAGRASAAVGGDIANPTPSYLENILTTLTRMRDVDRARGLSADNVELYKKSFVEHITEAFHVEKALERR